MRLLPALFAVACVTGGDTKDSTDTAGGTDTGDTADSGDTNDTEPTCATVESGDNWAWDGECPQMKTPCDIVVTECSLAIDYEADGGMTMGMPFSGTIEGDTITFANDNGVDDCVGTVIAADEIEGTCKGGCTFTLRRGR
ncbi:MAG: hypothetical protein FJ102_01220 [Deltaproteobacteria bacterium]|nr:hypothetical protein [Deltaproteobacteria bacterium]